MRFSFLLWAFLILLPVLDWKGISTSITRGMFALELKQGLLFSWPANQFWNTGQFIWVAFYVVLCGWIALLSARVVCAYGQERFETPPPPFFEIPSTEGGGSGFWFAFFASQLPGLWFLYYTARASVGESSHDHPLAWWQPVIGFLIGIVFALLAWFLTELFYRLARRLSGTTSRFFLMPLPSRQFYRAALSSTPNESWASRGVERLLRVIACCGGPGYQWTAHPTEVNSGIAFGILLFFFLLLIYALLGYLTRPVTWRAVWESSPITFILWTFLAFALVLPAGSLLYAQIFRPGNTPPGAQGSQRGTWVLWTVAVFLGGVLFVGLVWNAFPVLATILVLALSFGWAGSGLAFLLDRWRIPVLSTAAAILLVLFWWPISLDHFYTTYPRPGVPAGSPTPEEVIKKFRAQLPNEPLIIVTASGGGIHSAVWTSTVLDQLEKAFDRKGESFHRHVVLMSSVSGGSVAVSYWAENYLDAAAGKASFDAQASEDAARHSTCSSLESAAWGLLFPDMGHLLAWKDLAARLFPGLRTWDRGWALETAFERNREPDCAWRNDVSRIDLLARLRAAQVPHPEHYTLAMLREKLKDPAADIPAFVFNAAEVNGGRRLLLSSYFVPRFSPASCSFGLQPGKVPCPPSPQPARSFLDVCPDLDVSLFTAARLSATFPFATPVSVASLPNGLSDAQKQENRYCVEQHLADGGYYDNDGMDSAMEFLWSAFGYKEPELPILKAGSGAAEKAAEVAAPGGENPQENPCPRLSSVPCVIVVEIRNSREPSNRTPDVSPAFLGHIVEQLFAPPGTVLGAWNVAQSVRNQQQYRMMQFALRDKVDFGHFVFSYASGQGVCPQPGLGLLEKDPESWHLTPWAKENIRCAWEKVYQQKADQFAAMFHVISGRRP